MKDLKLPHLNYSLSPALLRRVRLACWPASPSLRALTSSLGKVGCNTFTMLPSGSIIVSEVRNSTRVLCFLKGHVKSQTHKHHIGDARQVLRVVLVLSDEGGLRESRNLNKPD